MKNNKGFTLLEIIVVVFILSLLAAIVAPKIMGRTDDARIAEAKIQIKNFETALRLFKLDNGFYPDTEQGLAALVERPIAGQIPQKYREGGYLEQKKIPLDPWGNPYIITIDLNNDEKARDAFYRQIAVSADLTDGNTPKRGLNGLLPKLVGTETYYEANNAVMVWSAGPDKMVDPAQPANAGVNRDNILSWK